ncbi:ankyrin repeat-containing protein Yar1p [Trichomonascus vanleenenianus]|uniref:Yar1p n=1 Tax=Trichomonascus vanleenenianus TaxID=2268995 RepID=UPI003ECA08FE
MSLTQDQIDDVLMDARAGELDSLKSFFEAQNKAEIADLLTKTLRAEYSEATLLHMAAANGHLEVVKYILELVGDSASKLVDIQNDSGNTALHWAALNGHLDVVKALCDAGAQPFITNLAKHDVFYEAEVNDQEAVIDYLLQRFTVEPEQNDENDVAEQVDKIDLNN